MRSYGGRFALGLGKKLEGAQRYLHSGGGVEATDSLLNDDSCLADLRTQMRRFSQLQLGDEQAAEDAVQETLVGALKNARTFAGRAALKTRVFAILKHKFADVLRKRHRVVDASSLLREKDEDEGSAHSLTEKATGSPPNARSPEEIRSRPSIKSDSGGSSRQVSKTCLHKRRACS